MKKLNKKILAGLALGGLVNLGGFNFNTSHVEASEVNVRDSVHSSSSSADDWKNNAGSTVVHGGGGETYTGDVTNREVTINGGNFTGTFGGMTSSGGAGNNTVIFNFKICKIA